MSPDEKPPDEKTPDENSPDENSPDENSWSYPSSNARISAGSKTAARTCNADEPTGTKAGSLSINISSDSSVEFLASNAIFRESFPGPRLGGV